jgi:hypothetical protein
MRRTYRRPTMRQRRSAYHLHSDYNPRIIIIMLQSCTWAAIFRSQSLFHHFPSASRIHPSGLSGVGLCVPASTFTPRRRDDASQASDSLFIFVLSSLSTPAPCAADVAV